MSPHPSIPASRYRLVYIIINFERHDKLHFVLKTIYYAHTRKLKMILETKRLHPHVHVHYAICILRLFCLNQPDVSKPS